MTPGTHVKVVNSYDATCNYIQPHKGHVLNFGNAAKIIQGFHMGHSFSGKQEVHQRVSKLPKKCIHKSIALYHKALHINYSQEHLGDPCILCSQIIEANLRKCPCELVEECRLAHRWKTN